MKNQIFIVGLILGIILISGCAKQSEPIIGGDKDEHGCLIAAGYSWCEAKQKCLRTWEEPCETGNTGLPNPASVYCEEQGGTLKMVETEAGTQGICVLEDGTECDEWAYFRGECPEFEKTFCKPEQRGSVACTMEYRPVCGWFDESIQCIKYPCAATYSNPCMACSDEIVAYWTEGECPE